MQERGSFSYSCSLSPISKPTQQDDFLKQGGDEKVTKELFRVELQKIKLNAEKEFLVEMLTNLESDLDSKRAQAESLQDQVFTKRLEFCAFVRESTRESFAIKLSNHIHVNPNALEIDNEHLPMHQKKLLVTEEEIEEMLTSIKQLEDDLKEFGDFLDVKQIQHEREMCVKLFQDEAMMCDDRNVDLTIPVVDDLALLPLNEIVPDLTIPWDDDDEHPWVPLNPMVVTDEDEMLSILEYTRHEVTDYNSLIGIQNQSVNVTDYSTPSTSKFKFKKPTRAIEPQEVPLFNL